MMTMKLVYGMRRFTLLKGEKGFPVCYGKLLQKILANDRNKVTPQKFHSLKLDL